MFFNFFINSIFFRCALKWFLEGLWNVIQVFIWVYACPLLQTIIYVTTFISVFTWQLWLQYFITKHSFMECYLEEEYIKFNISFIFHFKFPWDSQYARSKSENIVSERRHNLNQKIVTQYDQYKPISTQCDTFLFRQLVLSS